MKWRKGKELGDEGKAREEREGKEVNERGKRSWRGSKMQERRRQLAPARVVCWASR